MVTNTPSLAHSVTYARRIASSNLPESMPGLDRFWDDEETSEDDGPQPKSAQIAQKPKHSSIRAKLDRVLQDAHRTDEGEDGYNRPPASLSQFRPYIVEKPVEKIVTIPGPERVVEKVVVYKEIEFRDPQHLEDEMVVLKQQLNEALAREALATETLSAYKGTNSKSPHYSPERLSIKGLVCLRV